MEKHGWSQSLVLPYPLPHPWPGHRTEKNCLGRTARNPFSSFCSSYNSWPAEAPGCDAPSTADSVRKGRSGWICETSQGTMLLQEYRGTMKRLEFETQVLGQVRKSGLLLVDDYIRTAQGELISLSEDGTRHTLKHWYFHDFSHKMIQIPHLVPQMHLMVLDNRAPQARSACLLHKQYMVLVQVPVAQEKGSLPEHGEA